MVEMLVDLATAKGRDGLLNVPEHFHNALIYSNKDFFFLNPAFEAKLRRLIGDLNAIHINCHVQKI